MNQINSKNIPYLDGWRGLAIALLLVGHFFPVPGINLGSVGVNLFFVLSGVLMARLLFVDHVPIPTFYRRRASRIFPAVFCFLVLVVATYLALGIEVSWAETASAAAFVNNYFPGPPGAAVMPFGHIWSLCVEEHSYVVLSLVAVLARAGRVPARRTVGLLALALVAIGAWYWFTYRGEHLESERWIHSEVSAFGIFASAYLALTLLGRGERRIPFFVVPGLVVAGVCLHWWSVPAPLRTTLGVGAFALAINLLPKAGAFVHAGLSLAPLRKLGLWSFSIYLWQQPMYLYVHRHGLSPVLGVALAIVAGIVSFYCLENPARSYLNRKWAGGARQPAGAAAAAPQAH